jgi:hypothetical protein
MYLKKLRGKNFVDVMRSLVMDPQHCSGKKIFQILPNKNYTPVVFLIALF